MQIGKVMNACSTFSAKQLDKNAQWENCQDQVVLADFEKVCRLFPNHTEGTPEAGQEVSLPALVSLIELSI